MQFVGTVKAHFFKKKKSEINYLSSVEFADRLVKFNLQIWLIVNL